MNKPDDSVEQFVMGLIEQAVKKGDRPPQVDRYKATETISKHFDSEKPCRFKKGDWVTPKETTNLRGIGEPSLVIAAYETMQYQIHSDEKPLVVFDMLVARTQFSNVEKVVVYTARSEDYEPYVGLVYGDAGELEGRDNEHR